MNLNLTSPLLLLTSFVIALSLPSCKDDDIGLSSNVHDFKIWDIGNTHDASDIRVDFKVEINTGEITEYWGLIVKEGTSLVASQVPTFASNQIQQSTIESSSKFMKFESEQVDTDGDPIDLANSYQVIIYTPENGKISRPSEALTLKDTPPLSGKYKGVWDDNFYTAFGISAEITQSGNNISGIFYYSSSYTSCCGGSDDGTIAFSFNELGTITNFRYAQDLLNYMGGCPGSYVGSGNREGDFTFMVNFTGDDCDGRHEGGVLRLTKKE